MLVLNQHHVFQIIVDFGTLPDAFEKASTSVPIKIGQYKRKLQRSIFHEQILKTNKALAKPQYKEN